MKVSDCLLEILNITGGIEQYKLLEYYSELIELGYVEVKGIQLVLTKKGERKVKK